MTRRGKVITIGSFVGVAALGVLLYSVNYTIGRLPGAYAAWDTGTLLIEYLDTHDNHWPASWDDLCAALESRGASHLVLRGPHSSEPHYEQTLEKMVRVDWSFDPAHPCDAAPVARLDGSAFPVLWDGADPNEMVREHLRLQAARLGQ